LATAPVAALIRGLFSARLVTPFARQPDIFYFYRRFDFMVDQQRKFAEVATAKGGRDDCPLLLPKLA